MERHTNQVIILSGGEPLDPTRTINVPNDAYVIAADSGLHHAMALGLSADLIVGDMDSVDPAMLADAVETGALTDRHPADKDHTDLELAVGRALERGARRMLIIGAYAGRLDHLLGSMGLLAATATSVDEVVWTDGVTRVIGCVPHASVSIDDREGDGVSLIPASVDVMGITTDGLRWNLHGDSLVAGSTRGVSNVIERTPVSITIESGTLLVVHERAGL